MPRVAFVRAIMLNHWYHHRGQLLVYLRLLNQSGAVGVRSDRRRESVRGLTEPRSLPDRSAESRMRRWDLRSRRVLAAGVEQEIRRPGVSSVKNRTTPDLLISCEIHSAFEIRRVTSNPELVSSNVVVDDRACLGSIAPFIKNSFSSWRIVEARYLQIATVSLLLSSTGRANFARIYDALSRSSLRVP